MSYDPAIIKRFSDETESIQGEYWIESLKDGTPLLIRALVEADRARDRLFFERIEQNTPHFRFLATFSDLKQTHDQLMDVCLPNRAAYIALVYERGQLTQIGKARYGAYPGDVHCEFAVAVADDWQRQGVATALMQHLMDTAIRQGFLKISSMDSAGNLAMDGLAKSLGFTCREETQHGPQVFHEYVFG